MAESQLWGLADALEEGEPTMIEWGSGGGTIWLLENTNLRHLFSIEHAPLWAESVRKEVVDRGLSDRHTMVFCPEEDSDPHITKRSIKGDTSIKTDRSWSQVEQESPIGMAEYCSAAFTPLELADVILIDGLVRQTCLAEAAMRCRVGAHLFMHDTEQKIYSWGVQFMDRNPDWQLLRTFKPVPEDEYRGMELSEWLRIG